MSRLTRARLFIVLALTGITTTIIPAHAQSFLAYRFQPTPIEQAVFDRAAEFVRGMRHEVYIYRDWHIRGPEGRNWRQIGASHCRAHNDPRFCANAAIEAGGISIAHWSPATVAAFNATTTAFLSQCTFTLLRLASLYIHESHHLPPFYLEHGPYMTAADQAAMGGFLAKHGRWLAMQRDPSLCYRFASWGRFP